VSREKIERFAALVAKEPRHPLHNFALARALLQDGEFAAAEQAFARCLELDPSWMVAAIQRGRCLVELCRWDEARASLERGADLALAQHHEEPFVEIRELLDRIPG
jgi:tetratricopeptide (TPR) repeat protein